MKYTGHTNIANSGHFPASTVQIFPALTATTNWFTRGTPYYRYEVLLSLVKTPTVYLFFLFIKLLICFCRMCFQNKYIFLKMK